MQCSSQPLSQDDQAVVDSAGEAIAASPHILLFLHAPGPGGVERIALRLMAGWQRDGMNVSLVLGNPAGTMPLDPMAGIAMHSLPPWPLIGRRLADLRLFLGVLRAIHRQRPDIMFCAGNTYAFLAVLLKLRLGRSGPRVLAKVSNDLTRADMPLPVRPFYTAWLRLQGKLIDAFAALSDPMAREVAARMGIAPARVHVVPNPVLALADLDCMKPSAASPVMGDGRRFVAVGRLERQKDYPLMLRAYAAGRRPDDSLTIFGTGRAQARLERLAKHLGIAAHVHFAGFAPDILRQLPHYDVMLLSSRYEGQPGVLVEALASGLAIIATRCCASMAPLLADGALGTLVATGDADAFAHAIGAAQRGGQDLSRAREQAAAFTIERAVPAYRAVFRHMLATSQRQSPATAASFTPAPGSQSPLKARLS